MRTSLCFIVCLISLMWGNQCIAQIDSPNTGVIFDATSPVPNPSGLTLPASKKPGLSNNTNDPFQPKTTTQLDDPDKEEPIDISTDDGFLDTKSDKAPKYFTKDKEADKKFGKDQSLGNVTTRAEFVEVMYRDHEFVDGDRIRVLVNEDIVQSSVYLDSSFKGFKLNLNKGFNKVEFLALNQGSSGPNTAELHVYDGNGILISAKEWNLLTGNKATIIVIQE